MIKVGDIVESLCDFDKGRTTIPKGSLGYVVHEDIISKWFEASFIDPQSGANVILSLDLKSEGINWRLHLVSNKGNGSAKDILKKFRDPRSDSNDQLPLPDINCMSCPVVESKEPKHVFVGSHNLPYDSDYDDPFDALWRWK